MLRKPSRKKILKNDAAQEALQALNMGQRHDGMALAFAFAEMFTPKQKELFMSKLKGEALSKTDREYYSRVVRKKVLALANADLHQLAKRVLEL